MPLKIALPSSTDFTVQPLRTDRSFKERSVLFGRDRASIPLLEDLFGHPDPLVGDLTGNRESILRSAR